MFDEWRFSGLWVYKFNPFSQLRSIGGPKLLTSFLLNFAPTRVYPYVSRPYAVEIEAPSLLFSS